MTELITQLTSRLARRVPSRVKVRNPFTLLKGTWKLCVPISVATSRRLDIAFPARLSRSVRRLSCFSRLKVRAMLLVSIVRPTSLWVNLPIPLTVLLTDRAMVQFIRVKVLVRAAPTPPREKKELPRPADAFSSLPTCPPMLLSRLESLVHCLGLNVPMAPLSLCRKCPVLRESRPQDPPRTPTEWSSLPAPVAPLVTVWPPCPHRLLRP